MNYNQIIKTIAIVVSTVRVTNHSRRAHVSSSLHSPCTSLQSEVRSCLLLLHEGASVVEGSEAACKCCQFPEWHGLPSQSQRPGEMLPTAERNVETCSREGGIALGRHCICSIEESEWKVCRENHGNIAFLQWMAMRFFFVKSCVIWEGTSPLQAAAREESTICCNNHPCCIPSTRRIVYLSW